MSTNSKKASAYDRRKDASSAVPLDLDSDSDFNPGSFVPEPKKRGRKSNDSRKRGEPPSKKRRKEAMDVFDRPRSVSPGRPKEAVPLQRNLLAEHFGNFGIIPLVESEKEDADDEEGEEEEEEEEDRPDGEREDSPPPRVEPRPVPPKQPPPKPTPAASAVTNADDSVTEYESDEAQDGATPGMKRPAIAKPAGSKPFPNKKLNIDSDDSVTEPEPEELGWLEGAAPPTTTSAPARSPIKSLQRMIRTKPTSDEGSGSETEPEYEADPDVEEYTQPRPAFVLKPGQQLAGPLTLDREHKVPERINTFLREYQRDGIRFIWNRYKEGRGGLLGDDMGLVCTLSASATENPQSTERRLSRASIGSVLVGFECLTDRIIGKTIQVISFLSAIMKKRGDNLDIGRRRDHVSRLQDGKEWKKHRALPPANATWETCLIIAPSSVVPNWEREFETWGYFEVGMYIGPRATRMPVLNDFKMGRLDVLITSFDVARGDIDHLDDLPWSCIFIDEVHRVKNPKSKLATAFSRFSSPHRFGLSGTVIQNGYTELWTVLNWTNPGAVGTTKQWDKYVEKPLQVGQSKSASDEEHVRAALVAKILTEKVLPQVFLRRTKDIIRAQLPNKTDQVVFCPLTPTQIDVYKRIIGHEAVENLVRKDHPCDCGSGKARKKCCHPVHPGDLFKYMSTLIKISNHLALILPSPSDSVDQTARNRELASLAFGAGSDLKFGPSMLRPEFCGKWVVLETLLKQWRKDPTTKVLIFTKSVKLLQMLEFHLNVQGYGFVKLDGSTKQADRMPLIDRFQEDPDVFIFLVSTMAGGTGLNLTAANKVVIFDPNWNPAHDLQAMDRAYRFGQTRDVAVYRLLGAGSIEELIYARQVYKQQQMQVGYKASLQTRYFEGVQGDKSKQGELFGIRNIFKLHESTLATKMAIERANISDLDWAFAYMGGPGGASKRPVVKPKPDGVNWVYEEEAKTGKEYDDLRGLGALMFDDANPEVKEEPNDVEKTLSALGVQYTHRNDDLIAESTIEGQRVQKLLEEKKKAAKKAKQRRQSGKEKTPEPEWPPRRRHHKRPLSPRSKLRVRQRALIEQGLLESPEDLPKFAQEFAQKSLDEQTTFLEQLDVYAKTHFNT
ncbi:P-loop containing nucleoside triphosphate hydrolase protein [Daedaleopsis nitida]|nr:P-loop containing nucleoside triphosphate hydrolase protein [Daedaleopsis nitida]